VVFELEKVRLFLACYFLVLPVFLKVHVSFAIYELNQQFFCQYETEQVKF